MVDKKTMNIKKPRNFNQLPAELKRKVEEDVSRRKLICNHGFGLARYADISKVSVLTEVHLPKTKRLSDAEEDRLQDDIIDESIDELSEEASS